MLGFFVCSLYYLFTFFSRYPAIVFLLHVAFQQYPLYEIVFLIKFSCKNKKVPKLTILQDPWVGAVVVKLFAMPMDKEPWVEHVNERALWQFQLSIKQSILFFLSFFLFLDNCTKQSIPTPKTPNRRFCIVSFHLSLSIWKLIETLGTRQVDWTSPRTTSKF